MQQSQQVRITDLSFSPNINQLPTLTDIHILHKPNHRDSLISFRNSHQTKSNQFQTDVESRFSIQFYLIYVGNNNRRQYILCRRTLKYLHIVKHINHPKIMLNLSATRQKHKTLLYFMKWNELKRYGIIAFNGNYIPLENTSWKWKQWNQRTNIHFPHWEPCCLFNDDNVKRKGKWVTYVYALLTYVLQYVPAYV